MIYATGDTHGNFQRFAPEHFPEQAGMTKEDYMIICGDFGGVWDGGKKEERNLDWLEDLPFTTLFISGNHENFDLLRKYPTEEWNGGKIQRIRPHVIHLMRGQIFDLQGYSFFTMGGARSHDIEDGILNPKHPITKNNTGPFAEWAPDSGSTIAPGGNRSFPVSPSMKKLGAIWNAFTMRWTM